MNYKLLCYDAERISGRLLELASSIYLDILNINCIMCILSIAPEALRIGRSLRYSQL